MILSRADTAFLTPGWSASLNVAVRRSLHILAWVVIALLFVGTGIWTVWASHQPRTHSIWAPDMEEPLP